jgi:hypothetical protein
MTASGEIKTQAPMWWLRNSVGELAQIAMEEAQTGIE